MKEQIHTELLRLQQQHDIRILYAVESGSRAWGFASTDSDWDVRFIYVHRKEWYLSIDDKKDSIDEILPNDIDLSGWELRKALKLFRKSNPPLMEWLISPLLYLEQYTATEKLRTLSKAYFNPKSCLYHYLSMAHGNYQDYFLGEQVKAKKYFYVLRPILACKWIESNGTMPPMEFHFLVDSQVKDAVLRQEIDKLLERKIAGEELSLEPRNEIIINFVTDQLAYYQDHMRNFNINMQPGTENLNALFIETLEEVWS